MKIDNNILAGLVVLSIAVGVIGIYSALTIPVGVPRTGLVTGTADVEVPATVSISIPVNEIDFGILGLGDENSTLDGDPAPFEVRNIGSVAVDILANATALFDSEGLDYEGWQFQSACKDATECVPTENHTVTEWTTFASVPPYDEGHGFAGCLNFTSGVDIVLGHIRVEVPEDEPAGSKDATVTFTAFESITCHESELPGDPGGGTQN